MMMYSRQMAEPTIPHRLFTLEQEGRNDDEQDLEDDDDREELADDEKDRDTTAPTTPEPPTEVYKLLHFIGCISNHPHLAFCSCSPMLRNCAGV